MQTHSPRSSASTACCSDCCASAVPRLTGIWSAPLQHAADEEDPEQRVLGQEARDPPGVPDEPGEDQRVGVRDVVGGHQHPAGRRDVLPPPPADLEEHRDQRVDHHHREAEPEAHASPPRPQHLGPPLPIPVLPVSRSLYARRRRCPRAPAAGLPLGAVRWSVVVPVKRLDVAKSRLYAAGRPRPEHAELALALALDTVAAAVASRRGGPGRGGDGRPRRGRRGPRGRGRRRRGRAGRRAEPGARARGRAGRRARPGRRGGGCCPRTCRRCARPSWRPR